MKEKEPAESDAPASEPRRPAFARDFPRDPRLDELVLAFEGGDFARVRREAPALASSTADPSVRRAAEELRARIGPDRLALVMLALTAALLVALTAWWTTHDTPPQAPLPAKSAVEYVK